MKDLQAAKWMYLKAALFLVIGTASCALIMAAYPTLQVLVLLLLAIWSFCRAYYFAFYVIEKYVDGNFKFSGLFSALKYILFHSRS